MWSQSSCFSNSIHPSCLPWVLATLSDVPGPPRILCTMDPVLRTTSPIPSITPQRILLVFPSPMYLAVHDAWLRPAMGKSIGSSENQGSLENRNPTQGAALSDSFLILERLLPSWRVMALLGDAVHCVNETECSLVVPWNNLDVPGSERF